MGLRFSNVLLLAGSHLHAVTRRISLSLARAVASAASCACGSATAWSSRLLSSLMIHSISTTAAKRATLGECEARPPPPTLSGCRHFVDCPPETFMLSIDTARVDESPLSETPAIASLALELPLHGVHSTLWLRRTANPSILAISPYRGSYICRAPRLSLVSLHRHD